MSKTFTCLVLLFGLQSPALSQMQNQDDISYFNCAIQQIKKDEPVFWMPQTSYHLLLTCGRQQGLEPQSQIAYPMKIARSALGSSKLKNEYEVLQSQVHILDMNESQTHLKLELTSQQVFFLEVGDLVPIEIKVPHAYHSLLFQLSAMGIHLSNQKGEEWIPFNKFIQEPTLDWEALTLPKILDEIHAFSAYGDQVNGSNEIETGVFEGHTLSQAMADSTLLDVYTFLQYLYANPFDYMGHRWKFAEIYATWLVQGAPGPEEEETELIPDSFEVPYQQENVG